MSQTAGTRESGVPWIGNIREDWEVLKLTFVAKLESGHTPSRDNEAYWIDEECTIPWFGLTDIWQVRREKRVYIENTSEKLSEEGIKHSAARLLPANTVMLSRTASVGFPAIAAKPMATTQDFVNWICGPRLLPKFLYYVFLGMRREFDRLMIGSTHKTIYMPDVRAFRIPLPDLDTQKAIAAFLDRETARIDQLIEKKQRLVELLEEKSNAAIDAALKGELLHEPMQPVDDKPFTTEIPARWKFRRLKALCSYLGNGYVGPTRDILVDEAASDAVPYIQSTHIKNRRIDFERKPYFVLRSWLNERRRIRLRTNDLLIVQTGDCGATAIVEEEIEGAGCHALIITRPKPREIDPRLLLHLLASRYGRAKLEHIQTGALHPHLEVGFVKDLALPVPPREQHEELVEMIDRAADQHDRSRELTSTSIDRLREFRAALITAAVTGRIDPATWRRRGDTDRRLDQIEEALAS